MMKPVITPDSDLNQFFSEHQINILRAIRDGAQLRFYTAGDVSIELHKNDGKVQYIRQVTFDYLHNRTPMLALEAHTNEFILYSLSAIATAALNKLDGKAVETKAVEETPAAKLVNLSQAQIKVLKALFNGCLISRYGPGKGESRIEVLGNGEKVRISPQVLESLINKGLVDEGIAFKNEWYISYAGRAAIARYL